MQVLELVTINEENENSELPLEILYDAFDYFPSGIWAEIKFHGNINMDNDLDQCEGGGPRCLSLQSSNREGPRAEKNATGRGASTSFDQ